MLKELGFEGMDSDIFHIEYMKETDLEDVHNVQLLTYAAHPEWFEPVTFSLFDDTPETFG